MKSECDGEAAAIFKARLLNAEGNRSAQQQEQKDLCIFLCLLYARSIFGWPRFSNVPAYISTFLLSPCLASNDNYAFFFSAEQWREQKTVGVANFTRVWCLFHTQAVFVVPLPQSWLKVVCVRVCIHFTYLSVDRRTYCNEALGACLGQWNQV